MYSNKKSRKTEKSLLKVVDTYRKYRPKRIQQRTMTSEYVLFKFSMVTQIVDNADDG